MMLQSLVSNHNCKQKKKKTDSFDIDRIVKKQKVEKNKLEQSTTDLNDLSGNSYNDILKKQKMLSKLIGDSKQSQIEKSKQKMRQLLGHKEKTTNSAKSQGLLKKLIKKSEDIDKTNRINEGNLLFLFKNSKGGRKKSKKRKRKKV